MLKTSNSEAKASIARKQQFFARAKRTTIHLSFHRRINQINTRKISWNKPDTFEMVYS
jgi:hypothetical protein